MLKDRSEAAFASALERLEGTPALAETHTRLRGILAHLHQPMTVALVGRVSAGKSTLINALLEQDVAATGRREMTMKVAVLRHGESPAVRLHFRDGTMSGRRPLEHLADATASGVDDELVARVDWVEATHPSSHLRQFELVDTPGLDSTAGTESKETARLTHTSLARMREDTLQRASTADALLVVFSRAMSTTEQDTIDAFNRDLRVATPINAMGALTKIEETWPQRPDPLATGHEMAERIMAIPAIGQRFFKLLPVASLVAAGAATMTDDDAEAFTELARLPPAKLRSRVRRKREFGEADYDDVAVRADRRRDLVTRFERYGVALACDLIRDGIDDRATLRAELIARSGLPELRGTVTSHFGNRAHLVKLQRSLADAAALHKTVTASLDGGLRTRVHDAFAHLEHFELNEHGFAELSVLRDHFDGQLELTEDEEEELLRVTGEHGVWVHQRLHLKATATLDDMYEEARHRLRYWAYRDADPGVRGRTHQATRVIRRSYERLVHHIGQARRHLELVQ